MKNYLNFNYDLNSDDLTDVLDELPIWSAPFGLKLLENIKYKKNINVLDIGFGTGFPLTELAMRLGSSSVVYGIDPWEAGIKRAQKKINQYEINNIKILNSVCEKIPLPDNSIDLITSNNGLNNVSDLRQSLNECSRVIKQNGQFVQTVNLNKTMFEFYDVFEAVLKEMNLLSEIEKMHEHIYKKRKPLNEYLRLIENAGFKINNVIEDKFEYKFVDGTAMLNHFFIKLAFLEPWAEIVPAHLREKVFSNIESVINTQSADEGFFKLSVPFVLIDSVKL